MILTNEQIRQQEARQFWFGKYQGRPIREMILTNKQYVQWCIENIKDFTLTTEEFMLMYPNYKANNVYRNNKKK